MRPHRLVVSAVASVVLGGAAPALALSNPHRAVITIKCAAIDRIDKGPPPRCKELGNKDGWLDGRLEWWSGGAPLHVENGPFYVENQGDRGEVTVFLDGGGDRLRFDDWYLDPVSSILTLPDLRVKVYVATGPKGAQVLAADQPYLPVASALWARHSEDGAESAAAIAGEVTARQTGDAALHALATTESAARAAADAQLAGSIAAEAQARGGADAALAARVDAEGAARLAADAQLQAGLGGENAARVAADAGMQALLQAEIANRQQADGDTLDQAYAYTDTAFADATACCETRYLAEKTERLASDNAAATAVAALTVQLNNQAGMWQALLNALAAQVQQDLAGGLAQAQAHADALVAGEAAARQAADAAVLAAIAQETARAQAAEAVPANQIAAEAARAQQAESAAQASVNNEAAARQASDGALGAMLSSETARANNSEAALAAQLNGLQAQLAATQADLAAVVARLNHCGCN